MDNFLISCDWLSAGADAPEIRETTGLLTFVVAGVNLTQNEDIWSKTVRGSVLVSAYPLAMWLASSWWRLNFQPASALRQSPDLDWKLGHAMGAANHGFVWPSVVFSADGEGVQVSAVPSEPSARQSVRYLNGFNGPVTVSRRTFERGVERFIDEVLSRLHALGHVDTPLAGLWRLVQEDRSDAVATQIRRVEAQLGYDPETCPNALMDEALALTRRVGESAMAELAPAYSRGDADAPLADLRKLIALPGLRVKPELPTLATFDAATLAAPLAPWARGVRVAKSLREAMGNVSDPLSDGALYGLLGLTPTAVQAWTPDVRQRAGLALPTGHGILNFLPRKAAGVAKRFESARFVADCLAQGTQAAACLVSTDLATARQKFQRAFAAELLCPFDALCSFLDGDHSDATIEDAAQHFDVSERVIETGLTNHGYGALL